MKAKYNEAFKYAPLGRTQKNRGRSTTGQLTTLAPPARQHLLECAHRPARQLRDRHRPARRYAPGFSPIVGFPDPLQPDFAPCCPTANPANASTATPGRVRRRQAGASKSSHGFLGRRVNSMPDRRSARSDPAGRQHAAQALELALLTSPGLSARAPSSWANTSATSGAGPGRHGRRAHAAPGCAKSAASARIRITRATATRGG